MEVEREIAGRKVEAYAQGPGEGERREESRRLKGKQQAGRGSHGEGEKVG